MQLSDIRPGPENSRPKQAIVKKSRARHGSVTGQAASRFLERPFASNASIEAQHPSHSQSLEPFPSNGAAGRTTEPTPLAEVLHNANERKIVILRLKALQARIGLGRSAIYYLMDAQHSLFDAHFPRSIKLGAHAVGWIESEVEAWLEYRVAATRVGNQVAGQSK